MAGFRELAPTQAAVVPHGRFVAAVKQGLGSSSHTGPPPRDVPTWDERAASMAEVITETAISGAQRR